MLPTTTPPAPPGRPPRPAAVLTGTDLHKAYGPTPALAGASLRVEGGRSVAVTGPSGSGKSTLLYCLAA